MNVQIASENIIDIKASTTIDTRDVTGTSYPIDVSNTTKLAYYDVTTSITGTTLNSLETFDVTVVAKDQDGNNFMVTEDKNLTLSPSDSEEQLTIRTGTIYAGTDSTTITTSFENDSSGTRVIAKDQNHTRGETVDIYTVNDNTSLVFEDTFETGFVPNVWSDWYITVKNNTYKPGTTISNEEGHNSNKSLEFENANEESEIKVIDINAGAGGALLKFYYKYDKKGDDTDPRESFKLYDTVHSGVGLGYATTGGQKFNDTNGDWEEVSILLPPGEREIGWLFFSGIDTNNVAYIDDVRVYGNSDVSVINIHPEIIVTDESGGEGIEISSGDTIDLGSWGLGSGNHTFEFSILNEHKGNLNITDQGSNEYVNIDRSELSFSTGTNGFDDSISPFNYTDFELILSTGTNTGGQVTAIASILSNDDDESPYNINITYDVTTPIPDISVSYNENTINDNDSFSLGTAFIGYTNTFPITIENYGTDTLILTDQGSGEYVTVTGTEFSVANQPSSNISQNSSTTFEIEVDLSSVSAGTYTTGVTIQTNVVSPKDVYTFDLSVNAIDGLTDINESFENDFFDYPWILGYEDNDNPSFADQYDNTSEAPHIEDGDVIDGDSEFVSPTDGTKMVQFGQVEINGNDSTEAAPIGGKDKSYIEIIFNTTEDKTLHFDWMVDGDDMNVYLDGTKEISISHTNSDGWIHDKILITTGSSHIVRWEYEKDIYNSYYSDTGWLDNVYTETAKSEMEVTTPLTIDPLQDGISVVDLGSFGTGNAETFEFTIKNTDLLDLELTGSPLIVLPSGTQLSVNTPPITPIPYENTTTFIIQINPTTLVTDQQETISIPNNSPDGDFTFDVVYDVVNPVAEINVKDPNDNDILNISGVFSANIDKDSATPYDYTFTIENIGTGELVLNEHNNGSGDYVEVTTIGPISVTTQPTTPIEAYTGTSTFTVTVTPDGNLTTYTATVEILSNDSDESPYTFDINIYSSIKNLIDSFENYDDNQQIKDFTVSSPWGTPWDGGVSSDYQGSDSSLPKEPYVNEVTYPTNYKYLILLGFGVLGNDTGPNGESGLSGRWNTGYTYAQLSFTPTADGEIEFFIRIAKDLNPTVPIGEDTVSFWMDIDSSDIGLPGEPTPDWTYTLGPDENISEIIVTFPVTSGTVYNLTWKVQKDTAGHRENMIRLDEIYYWELP